MNVLVEIPMFTSVKITTMQLNRMEDFGITSGSVRFFVLCVDWYEVCTDLVTFLVNLLNKPVNPQNVLLQTQSHLEIPKNKL